ncbi:MAG: hypothetical protein AB7U73_05420 [Pirellulales bacterium]
MAPGASLGFLTLTIAAGAFTRLVWIYGDPERILIPALATLLFALLTVSILFRRGWEIVLRVAVSFLELVAW